MGESARALTDLHCNKIFVEELREYVIIYKVVCLRGIINGGKL